MKYEYHKYRLELVRETTITSEYEHTMANPGAVRDFLVNICKLNRQPQETLMVIALNAKGKIIGYTTASIGDITSSIVHPREIFKYLIACNAAAGIICHNHPSEDPEPSTEDISVTERIVQAGEILGIKIVDHIIIGNETDYVSLKSEGYL